ncbi:MAG: adenylyl-sulfate kinase, partial [Chloroflexi bacterium]|nr:adenylyl-sulfate kinase [Chloroflexota bacterium]
IIVNKMDLVDYSEDVYRAIETEYRRYLASINVTPERFVPASAKAGENIVASSPKMPWFTGPTVLDALGLFQKEVSPADAPLRLPLQDVYKFDARRILAGRVVAGTVSVGDRLVFSPSNKTASVRSIELFNIDPPPNRAIAGQSIGVTLDEQIFVERGEIASHETRAPLVGRTFRGNIFWMGKRPLSTTGTYILRLATGEAPCRVTAVHRIIDASELGVVDPNGIVNRNEVAEISIETRYPIAFDLYGDLASTGRFVLVDEYDVAGGGIVTEALDERAEDLPRERASESGQTTGELRQERFGHHAALIVIKGTEAARVTAVARQLETMLVGDGRLAYLLRPESLQPGIDRGESARRLDEVTRFLLDAGQIVIWPMSGDGEEEITTIRTLVRPAPAIVAHLTEAPGQLSEVDLWIGGAKSVDEAGDRLLHELQRSGLLAPAFNEPRRFRSLT